MSDPSPYVRQWLTVTLCLLLPVLCFQQWRPGFQLPGARSGDEPHYLVMAYSLVYDGDLFVDDDYATPRFRDPRDQARTRAAVSRFAAPYQQGFYLSGFPLSHHSNLVANSREAATLPVRFLRWDEVYEFRELKTAEATIAGSASSPDSRPLLDRFEVVRRPAYADFETQLPGPLREIAWHPPGYPILLSIVAWLPMRTGAAWAELWIVVIQIALLAAALVCAQRLTSFDASYEGAKTGPLAVAAVGLCTAAGYYAATLYTEAITPALCLFALYAFDRHRLLLCSLMLGLLFFIKESHAPLAVIFAAGAWLRDTRVTSGLRIAAFPALAFILFLIRNLLLYGTPFQTYYPWMTNPDIPAGVLGLLGDAKTGVLVFTPVALVALFGLRRLTRRHRVLAAVIAASCAYYFALSAATVHWSGGPSYAYRLLVPAVAMLIPGFFVWWRARPALWRSSSRWTRVGLVLCTLLFWVSFVNGFFAATNLAYAYDADAYINLLEPMRSGLVKRVFE